MCVGLVSIFCFGACSEKCEHNKINWVEVLAPSCTMEGEKQNKCSDCGKVFETEIIAKTAHSPSEWIEDSVATCSEQGLKHKECTECFEILEFGTIAKTAHSSSEWIEDSVATCSEQGLKHKECTECFEILEFALTAKTEHININNSCKDCDAILGVGIKSDLFKIDGNELSISVLAKDSLFDFNSAIKIANEAKFGVYLDSACEQKIATNVVQLDFGNNMYYIKIVNGVDSKVYIANISRIVDWGLVYTVSGNEITGLTDFGKTLMELTIPEKIGGATITSIGENAFAYNNTIKLVSFDENSKVQTIGERAFDNCQALEYIKFPASLISISEFAVSCCNSLINISFEENSNLENISDNAFSMNPCLESIEIPASVKAIGSSALWGGSKLIIIRYKGTIEEWNKVDKKDGWADECLTTEVMCSDGVVNI